MRTFANDRIIIDGGDTSLIGGHQASAREVDTYDNRVLHLLESLDGNDVGHIIIQGIRHTDGQTATIVPARTIVDSQSIRGARPGAQASAPASVGVPFSTGRLDSNGFPVNLGAEAAAFPEAVLLHELVHALHQMRGGIEPYPMADGYDNREEFYAIVITNIYCSLTHHPLRRNHHGFAMFDPSSPLGVDFHLRYTTEIDALANETTGLGLQIFSNLSRVPAMFNPVREFVRHLARNANISEREWFRRESQCLIQPLARPRSFTGPALSRPMF